MIRLDLISRRSVPLVIREGTQRTKLFSKRHVRTKMLSVVAAASTATVYLKEDFSGDCARLPLEPAAGAIAHLSKPVLWQGRAAGL